ncbi:MAG: hypothetical protein H7839_19415 [Magnetococcus sp. YQC-5]
MISEKSINRTLEKESCQHCPRRKGRGTQLMTCASYPACLEETTAKVVARVERSVFDLHCDLCDRKVEEIVALTEKLLRGEGVDDYDISMETINRRYDGAIQATREACL